MSEHPNNARRREEYKATIEARREADAKLLAESRSRAPMPIDPNYDPANPAHRDAGRCCS